MTKEKLIEIWVSLGYSGPNPKNLSEKELAQDLLNVHYEELVNGYRIFNSDEIQTLTSIISKR